MWTSKTTFSSYVRDFPVRETELIQLGKGALGLKTMQVFGHHSFFIRAYCAADSVWHILGEKDWVAIWIPISWQGVYSFNGIELEPDDIILADSEMAITTTSCKRNGAVIGVRRSVFEAICRKVSERSTFVLPRGHRVITCTSQRKYALYQVVKRLCEVSDNFEKVAGKFYIPNTQEADAIAWVAGWVVDSIEEDTTGLLKRKSEYGVFAAAIDAVMRTDCKGLSIADLCDAAGVGKSRLHESFAESCGVSPAQFLIKLRLTAVREQLLNPETSYRSVKDAALAHGFNSLGRFAGYYRDAFGEYPAKTRQRTGYRYLN